MEKSWVSHFLPKDEYKEKRILLFIAESVVLIFALSMILIFLNVFIEVPKYRVEGVLLLNLISISGYVLIRYVFSGIEYTNVFDINDYKKEFKKIIYNSFKFAVVFAVISSLLVFTGNISFKWIDVIGLTVLGFLFMLLLNYISLRYSFKKNSLSNQWKEVS